MNVLNTELDFSPHGPASENEVVGIENLIGTNLPVDYRHFLLSVGGGFIQRGVTRCQWPTPFGNPTIVELSDIEGIRGLLDSDIIPRNMICIGAGHLGVITCLAIAGLDHGYVYALDTEMKYYWTKDHIDKFKDLAPSIRNFFRDRDSGQLPPRPWGYENCYLIAGSFSLFAANIVPKL